MSDIILVMKEALFARLMPLYSEITITASATLKPEHYPLYAAAAIAAAMVAYALLYLLGMRMRRLPARYSTDEQRARIAALEAHARYWLPYLLVLAPTPLGTVLLLAAGFFSIRPWLVAFVACAAELLYRYMHMLPQ